MNLSSNTLGKLHAKALLLCASLAITAPASATILIFDEGSPGTPAVNSNPVPAAYGDNVTGASTGGFSYGVGAEGFTPNVVASYGTSHLIWDNGYGDLSNIVWVDNGGAFELTLSGQGGAFVQLYGFDMAGWPNADYTINSVSVSDGGGGTLFSQSNVLIEGDGIGDLHSSFDFAAPLTASEIVIRFDSSNLGGQSDNIGIDNIRFGQTFDVVVNSPGTPVLFALGAAALMLQRRKQSS